MGASPDSISITDYGVGIEFHQGKLSFSDKMILQSTKSTTNPTRIAKANSVLLCVRAPVGEVNITDRDLCIGRGLASVSPIYEINTEFLFYWLKTVKSHLNSMATGSTFAAIISETVKKIIIPLPPPKEQLRILNTIKESFNSIKYISDFIN